MAATDSARLERMRQAYPDKFVSEEAVFSHIHRGDRIFIGTGCGEPQHLVRALVKYVESHPKAIFDAEVIQVWTLGLAPYAEERFQGNFRHNSFFIGSETRKAVNQGLADYTPIFLSEVPEMFYRRTAPIDVALIQVSPPDDHGYLSLGVSVDIVKAASEMASIVVAQLNGNMPRVHGDGFIHIKDTEYVIPFDEPLLEYSSGVAGEVAQKMGGIRLPSGPGWGYHPGRVREHPQCHHGQSQR